MGKVPASLALGQRTPSTMPLITGTINYRHVSQALTDARNQVPYATATFLTRLVMASRDRFQKALPQRFDRPTPFTVRRVTYKPASRSSLRAMVGIPDSPEQAGRATSEYMRPGALGTSARHQKKSEYLLSIMGYLPQGWVMVPGSFMKGRLDGYGNVPGSYYKQVIRDLQIKTTKGPPKPRFGAAQRRAARMGVVAEFFAVGRGRNTLNKGGGWLPPGVYRRTGRRGDKLEQYFVFVPRAKYQKRVDIREAVVETYREQGPILWRDAAASVRARFAARAAR